MAWPMPMDEEAARQARARAHAHIIHHQRATCFQPATRNIGQGEENTTRHDTRLPDYCGRDRI